MYKKPKEQIFIFAADKNRLFHLTNKISVTGYNVDRRSAFIRHRYFFIRIIQENLVISFIHPIRRIGSVSDFISYFIGCFLIVIESSSRIKFENFISGTRCIQCTFPSSIYKEILNRLIVLARTKT